MELSINADLSRNSGQRSRSWLDWVLAPFTSVWFGISLLSLLFVYCSIGSAVPAVRQLPWIERTEYEWYHWWPFQVLVGLFALNITTITIRRIPLRLVNAGVWTIHTGVILLVAGSFYYFTTKVEGDAPVYRRQVSIQMPGLNQPRSLVVIPQSETKVVVGPDVWRFAIQSTNSQWPILSDEDKGKTAYAVNVLVTPPTGEPFVRQLLAGYPQYTEDVLPGKGRAIKNLGRKLVDENLSLELELAPQDYFHVQSTWALYSRRVGETEWNERPLRGLPRYNDRIDSREAVLHDPHHPVVLRPIDLESKPVQPTDPLSNAAVHITGYLRHAVPRLQWRDDASQWNPVVQLTAVTQQDGDHFYELIAFDPTRNKADSGMVQFLWLDDAAMTQNLPTDARAMLTVSAPQLDAPITIPLTVESVVGRDGAFTPIEKTDYAYRIVNVVDDLPLPGGKKPVSVVMVEVRGPDGTFTRMVADNPDMTRDISGDGGDPHSMGGMVKPVDPRIVMTYQPRSAPVILAAYPAGLFLAVNGTQGRLIGREIEIGKPVDITSGLALRVDGLWRKAVAEVKPYVVPPHQREREAGESYAMIRLELDTGKGVQKEWLRYSPYVLPSAEFSYPGRFPYIPTPFRLADGSVVEVVFSRQRQRLPNPIGMEDFDLDTHVGGYTGSVSTIRNYVSRLRFLDGGKWTEPTSIHVNGPTEYGGLWYFQSNWDRPSNDNPNGGMNYTGLGVANRNGVYIQLLGCCVSVAGMLFAFYIKPVLIRRRRLQSQARISTRSPDSSAMGEESDLGGDEFESLQTRTGARP